MKKIYFSRVQIIENNRESQEEEKHYESLPNGKKTQYITDVSVSDRFMFSPCLCPQVVTEKDFLSFSHEIHGT